MLRERVVHSLIGTPLHHPLEAARRLYDAWMRPGVPEIHREYGRIEALIKQTVVDPGNCIDVGCHLGSVLDLMVRCSPHGRHVAVEPLAHKAAWLKRKYPGVEVHQLALGETSGTVDFLWNPRRSGLSSLRGNNAQSGLLHIQVPMRRLDELVADNRPIRFIKIDVEGGEIGVLAGARRTLANHRPLVLFECTRTGTAQFGITAARVFEFVTRELGYRIFLVKEYLGHGSPLDLEQFERAMDFPFQAFNFVAAPCPG
jgi:FkbM family methyltransferase